MTKRLRIEAPAQEVHWFFATLQKWRLVERQMVPDRGRLVAVLLYEQPFLRLQGGRVALAIILEGDERRTDLTAVAFAAGDWTGFDWGACQRLLTDVEKLLRQRFPRVWAIR